MNRQDETDHLTEQVNRLDFAAALRREEEQMALQRADMRMPLWLLALIWMAIGAVLFGGLMIAGWLVWRG
jgi:type VI protein secretion system component VasF